MIAQDIEVNFTGKCDWTHTNTHMHSLKTKTGIDTGRKRDVNRGKSHFYLVFPFMS
jgi:hypothetical protein